VKPRHVDAYLADARAILQAIKARPGQDFFTLSPSQVSELVELAAVRHYRKPKNANGSTARHFYALTQRRAKP
jgi:hypothetical protein